MNKIQVWLRKGHLADYEEGVALYKKYGSNKQMLQNFLLRGKLQSVQGKLRYELQKLAPIAKSVSLPEIEEKPTAPPYPTLTGRLPDAPLYALAMKKAVDDIPQVIQQAIILRQKAANARDKAGRLLTEEADQLSKEKRAELIAEQKHHHGIVMKYHEAIQKWKNTGLTPDYWDEGWMEEVKAYNKPQLTEQEIDDLKDQLQKAMQKRSKAKKRLAENRKRQNASKVAYYQQRVQEADAEVKAIQTKLKG